MTQFPLLTTLILTPLAGGLLLGVLGGRNGLRARRVAFAFTLLALALALFGWSRFAPDEPGLQFVERHSWIQSLNVDYFLGVDGLGLLMVLLSAIVPAFAIVALPPPAERPSTYYALLLCLQAGLFGAFTALNFFHWFIFWELSLVPAYFLIKLWGGAERVHAATQFFVYTLAGSVTMLLGFLALFLVTGSFDFVELADRVRTTPGGWAAILNGQLAWSGLSGHSLALILFAGIFLGFAVKVPVVPFHTWLPLAYAEAPPGVTMVLTGVMSKMGVYGFVRILLPIFPEQMRWVLPALLWLAVLSIVASAFAAFAQRDLKRMIGYSSVNHLGYCLLGAFAALEITGPEAAWSNEKAAALNGVLLQMFNHGLSASALFWFLGLLEQRTGRRGLNDFGGLRKVAPLFCGLMGVAVFASLGLPGLNGFVGEFLIFKGSFALAPWAPAISVLGLLATAVFLLTMSQRVFHGPLPAQWNGFSDLTRREIWTVIPVTALIFLVGVYPEILLRITNTTVVRFIAHAIS